MEKEEKKKLQRKRTRKYQIMTVFRGIFSIPLSPPKLLISIIAILLGVATWNHAVPLLISHMTELSRLFPKLPLETVAGVIVGTALLIIAILMLYFFGRPIGTKKAERGFQRIGLVNRIGEAPLLVHRARKKDNKHIKIREFDSEGIPLVTWQEKKSAIESVLNCHIVNCIEGKKRQRIIIEIVPHTKLPKNIEWKDEYVSDKDFELVLGVGYAGLVTYNMAKIPCALIGGEPGSGKTVLLQNLIHQCRKKGASVWIADFKGGVDYPYSWRSSHFITDKESLLETLKMLVGELEDRQRDFAEAGIIERLEEGSMDFPAPRWILAFDEISEALDTSGLDVAAKKQVSEIDGLLRTIARQGRALGIHLLLGTQRLDSTIASGQLTSNIGFRVCGRAGKVLSEIVIGSREASEKVPMDGEGRFVTREGVVFQGYNFIAK